MKIANYLELLDDTVCRLKGGSVFNSSQSGTWNNVGLYELGLDPLLGFSGAAYYGFDQVVLENQEDQLEKAVVVLGQVIGH